MSKAYRDKDRSAEQELKNLRRIFDKIDETIVLPRSLHADILRQKLDGVTPDGLKVKKPFNTREFFKSRVFSLQSVVTYALAFVVIVVVAYSTRVTVPDIVDGTIAIQENVAQSDEALQPDSLSPPQAAHSQALEAEDDDVAEASMPAQSSTEAATTDASLAQSETADVVTGGQGGGGEAYALGEDEAYSYICRQNDQTDPDKAGIPMTLEIVDKSSGALLSFLDIEDMERIDHFYDGDGFFGVVGTAGGEVIFRAYTLVEASEQTAAVELFEAAQSGQYLDARLVDGVLHVVTVNESADYGDAEAVRLPDSSSDASCVITSADVLDGELEQIAYLGVDIDKRISIQNHNVYIPYDVITAEATELYMAQVKLEGITQEMVLVP